MPGTVGTWLDLGLGATGEADPAHCHPARAGQDSLDEQRGQGVVIWGDGVEYRNRALGRGLSPFMIQNSYRVLRASVPSPVS